MSALMEPAATRRKAREIIDANPGATLVEVVALAYLEGRVDGLREARPHHDNSACCQRCGRTVRLGSSIPADMVQRVVCAHCSTPDEARVA